MKATQITLNYSGDASGTRDEPTNSKRFHRAAPDTTNRAGDNDAETTGDWNTEGFQQ